MEKDYISIREFAALVGVSVQSIYKKLLKEDNPLKEYLLITEQGRLISKEAISLYGLKLETDIEERKEDIEIKDASIVEENNPTDKLIAILETQMEELKRQLIEKDKQLAEKDKQIESLLARLEESSTIIQQQQTLTAINTQLYTKQLEEPEETAIAPVVADEVKVSFWKKIWKRN